MALPAARRRPGRQASWPSSPSTPRPSSSLKPPRLAAAALVAVLCCCGPQEARAQLLKKLGHIDPAKLPTALGSKSPAQLAEAIKDKATRAAEKLEEVATRTNPKNGSGHALEEAANSALQKGADAVVHAKNDVEGTLKDGSSGAGSAVEAIKGITADKVASALKDAAPEAIKKGVKPDEVATALREATPQVAQTLNRTSQQLAGTLQSKSPQLANKIVKQGLKTADAISPGAGSSGGSGGVDDDDDFAGEGLLHDKGFSAPLVGGILLVLAAGGGYVVFQRFKGQSQRSPILLSEALQDFTGGSSRSHHPGMQQSSQEPFFQSF